MDKLKVIFVDDNQSLLDGLKRSLRRQAKQWDIRFYIGGNEALEEIDVFKPDIVVTDMRMPKMNGVELLEKIRAIEPKTIRFILSGYSDRELILKSVGVTHQFFAKPVEMDAILDAINFSNSLYQRINNPEIQNIVCGISSLPVPSFIYDQINDELKKEEPSLDMISSIIKEDASLSAKILQLVNSAFFGIGSSITDINQATVYLGVDVLKYLVLSYGVSDDSFSDLRSKVDLNSFSSHAILVGNLSKKIATEIGMNRSSQQAAFASGLLHDVGKLVMAKHFSEDYYLSDEFKMQSTDSEYTQDLESSKFKINHADIGASLLALWGLPPQIVNATAFHHKPHLVDQEEITLSTIVHLANALSYKQRFSSFDEMLHSSLLNYDYINSLGLIEAMDNWSFINEF